mmetsp:Transcript_8528/g.17298  ORF Transcript_8528/g.17298 Transcript_8528/m.17298 type:complete len:281 (-) Transcript_8528:71-913(-)|eukprot:CAMPEP_0174707406 /NCGR_PEP_ID=MMETSP1094-20130205/9930_1 /TAXON_ID=156173 /ORGANISM="Chrysochromulina brevifilum, Strain UTEX LB 985" /LENGTH=280 /DNA_ID=CAMNT_0015905781 /DNA_START=162 /DNA_END=1004 /DNA_ORIENTATION=-
MFSAWLSGLSLEAPETGTAADMAEQAVAAESPDPRKSEASESPEAKKLRQRACDALQRAEDAFSQGEESAAMQLVEESLKIFHLPDAQTLLDRLKLFGPGSVAHATVNEVLRGKDSRGVLGLSAGPVANAALKKAYHQRCLLLHPDRCKAHGAEDAFKRVQHAYSVLNGRGEESTPVKAQQPPAHRSRRGKPPPGTTSGARWGHGQAAHRGGKPSHAPGGADPRRRKPSVPTPPQRRPPGAKQVRDTLPRTDPPQPTSVRQPSPTRDRPTGADTMNSLEV